MEKTDLTIYDIKPEDMVNYLRYNGPHFSKKLCDFAVSLMTKIDKNTGKESSLKPFTREEVDNILHRNNIILKQNALYDHVYVANMIKADFLGESIEDEKHLAKHIKCIIDDIDAYDGVVFNRWYGDMCKKGIVIDWEYMI